MSDSMPATVKTLVAFIRSTFVQQNCSQAVIAVSGGIDSALSLTLLSKAVGIAAITPLLLPFGDQDMSDAKAICEWCGFLPEQIKIQDIASAVHEICILQSIPDADVVRRGNVMARIRMIIIFDTAKELQALVCGTENKSEHYLGYFTRFGDAASDIEPLSTLYKTEVRELAAYLGMPDSIVMKPPSAGLWLNQSDEAELGFSYTDADKILRAFIDESIPIEEISIPGISKSTIQKVCQRVISQQFKLRVPYTL